MESCTHCYFLVDCSFGLRLLVVHFGNETQEDQSKQATEPIQIRLTLDAPHETRHREAVHADQGTMKSDLHCTEYTFCRWNNRLYFLHR